MFDGFRIAIERQYEAGSSAFLVITGVSWRESNLVAGNLVRYSKCNEAARFS